MELLGKVWGLQLLLITAICICISKITGEKFFIILAIMIDISTMLLYIIALRL